MSNDDENAKSPKITEPSEAYRLPKMRDEKGVFLSAEEVLFISNWFNEKSKQHPDGNGGTCEVCGQRDWSALSTMFTETGVIPPLFSGFYK